MISYVPSVVCGLLASVLVKAVDEHEVGQDSVAGYFSDSDMKGTLVERRGQPLRGALGEEGWNPRMPAASPCGPL